ncbi:NAD(P)/FAD-dependent oxidoreductase [Paenibacillus sp. sgz500958]|uniref:NAD(P)/FAD-dependent oxidoreductase n=1 Tax=Paenibacillus sp. sgz500958 TaxID=3242475 RepID=UPI0036D22097
MIKNLPIAIIGGGMSGIMAALTLKKHGYENVFIVEKSRSVGGRMATRRMDIGKVDHGAQFFTARTERFQAFVDDWIAKGTVKCWFGDKHPRYMAVDGMNSFANKVAEGIPTRFQTKVEEIRKAPNGYTLVTDQGECITASGIIFTVPAPQTKAVIDRNHLGIDSKVLQKLSEIRFQPCLVGLFLFHKKTNLPRDGHLDRDLPEGIQRLVDHEKKTISPLKTVSVYMTGEWSQAYYGFTDEEVLDKMRYLTSAYFEYDSLITSQLKKWRYAQAVHYLREPYLDMNLEHPLLVAGDAFLYPGDPGNQARLESAFISGIMAAGRMIHLLDH